MDIQVDKHTVVVFDLDDTLYNELDFLKSAYKSIAIFLENKNWKPLYSKLFSLYRCKLNVFEFIVTTYSVEMELLIEMYKDHQPDIHVFDGVIETFEAIKSKNGKIGIITDGRSKTQRTKIKCLGIAKYIDELIISDEIGSEKPSKTNFELIEKSLFGKTYYYIADNLKKDFLAPNELGWQSIALVDNGKNIHFQSHECENEKNLPQDYILNFKEINII
ncbi:HAD family hydrolase [Gelidibacter salicanalis]|uniref:HAD family hydrolase n=1 Tax=Gelidibacter salicanalis TaxID=291193 RepID=A0A934KSD6_9FLAO|nr:HAD family hydrolase [Gelidibacter salicanalis]MBJ7882699.1 HAD family hydrolase [Gelidibacter salicanalis]